MKKIATWRRMYLEYDWASHSWQKKNTRQHILVFRKYLWNMWVGKVWDLLSLPKWIPTGRVSNHGNLGQILSYDHPLMSICRKKQFILLTFKSIWSAANNFFSKLKVLYFSCSFVSEDVIKWENKTFIFPQ